MIWNVNENRFSWPFIILVVFSTVYLVGFDLIWRHVNIGFIELALLGLAGWVICAAIIYKKSKSWQ